MEYKKWGSMKLDIQEKVETITFQTSNKTLANSMKENTFRETTSHSTPKVTPNILWNLKIQSPSLVSILNQMRPVHTPILVL
jgi:hypothetical protein